MIQSELQKKAEENKPKKKLLDKFSSENGNDENDGCLICTL